MIRKIEFLKNPERLVFPGQANFLVNSSAKRYNNFMPYPDDYVPIKVGIPGINDGLPLNIYTGENNTPGTVYNGDATPAILLPSFPDFSKMECTELSQHIFAMQEALVDPGMTQKSTAYKQAYANGLSRAKEIYIKGCTIPQNPYVPPKKDNNIIPSDDGSGQPIVKDNSSNVKDPVITEIVKESITKKDGIPVWLWVAGGVVVLFVALK